MTSPNQPPRLRPWKTLGRKLILNHNTFLQVESHVIELPDGRVIPDWPWVIIPDAVIVLPMTEAGAFLCFRQTKYAVEGTSLAPVGGMLEAGETPLDAAKRELLEEMGYAAQEWVSLGETVLDPNRRVATMHLFLALNAQKVAEPDSDDLEDQVVVQLALEALGDALRKGEFKVTSWALVVALALNHLGSTK